MNKKKIFVGISLLVVILLVVVSIVIKNKFDKFDSVITVYDEVKNESAIYINSKYIDKVGGKATIDSNMSNSTYYICTDKSTYIMEDEIITEVGDAMTIIDIANFSNEALLLDGDNQLFIYKNDELKKITGESVYMATISGDGKTYSYTTEGGSYFGTKQDKEQFIEDVIIAYISNNAEVIYGLKYDEKGLKDLNDYYGTTYYQALNQGGFYSPSEFDLLEMDTEGNSKVISEDVYYINGLNSKGNEIMYYTEQGTFVRVDGENKKVTEQYVYSLYYTNDKLKADGDFYAIDSFKEVVCEIMTYEAETEVKSICKISDKYVAETIAENSRSFVGISDDMSRIFYLDEDKALYRVDARAGAEKKLLAEDVDFARVSPDGKDVYFTREDGADLTILYHSEKGLKEKQLAIVYDFFDIIVYNGYCYLEAREIYYIENDKVTEMDDLRELDCFFIDYAAKKVYGYDENNVYEVKKDDTKTLEGKYEKITAYDYVY